MHALQDNCLETLQNVINDAFRIGLVGQLLHCAVESAFRRAMATYDASALQIAIGHARAVAMCEWQLVEAKAQVNLLEAIEAEDTDNLKLALEEAEATAVDFGLIAKGVFKLSSLALRTQSGKLFRIFHCY